MHKNQPAITNGDSTEKVFRILKTDLDIFPMRVRKESTFRGMISSGLIHRYSLEKMLLELKRTRKEGSPLYSGKGIAEVNAAGVNVKAVQFDSSK